MGGTVVTQRTRGVALVAVLWVVAALSIMVGGAIYGSRAETRAVTVDRQIARAAALADAAIAHVLQSWTRPGQRRSNSTSRVLFAFDGVDVALTAYPLAGLIDINTAPEDLLTAVFVYGAGLSRDAASVAAQAVTEARRDSDAVKQGYRFAAVEELLQVPGIGYDTYSSVANLLTVGGGSGGRVNPMAAPRDVLRVLADGDGAAADRYVQDRENSGAEVPAWTFNAPWISAEVSNRYMFDVVVPKADGMIVRVTRWVDLDVGREEGLPWTVFHGREVVEAARQ